MIEVRYQGRLGNTLFQYALGRILATELGWSLRAEAIAGFAGTAEPVPGDSHEGPLQEFRGHRFDLDAVLLDRSPRRIRLDGFFQRHELYRAHRDRVRSWLRLRPPAAPPPRDAVVVHVRRKDYLQHGYALPFSYYEEAILRSGARRVFLATDDPWDPFLWAFRKFRPQLVRGGAVETLAFLASAPRLVLSQSSFGWWAAFLGEPETVFAPRPAAGVWARDDVSLIEEDRFQVLSCGPYVPRLVERNYQALRLGVRALRSRARGRLGVPDSYEG